MKIKIQKSKFVVGCLIFIILFSGISSFISINNTLETTNPRDKTKTLNIDKNLVKSLQTSANGYLQEQILTEMVQGGDGIYRGNVYSAVYSNDIYDHQKLRVGPYGINDGLFGSDYRVNIPSNDYDNDFPNPIPNQYYPSPGTISIEQQVTVQPLGLDPGIKNLLERIGALSEVYKDGTYLYDITALPSGEQNILINSVTYPEYHKPIIIDIERQWEAYTLYYHGTAETDGTSPQNFIENPYPMFTLYVPHLSINFEIDPAFNSYLMQKTSSAGITATDFTSVSNLNLIFTAENAMSILKSGKNKTPGSFKDTAGSFLKGQLKAQIAKQIIGFGFDLLGIERFPGDVDLAWNVYSYIKNIFQMFAGAESAVGTLIGILITSEIIKAQQAIQEMKTIRYYEYLVNLNYFKAAIYAAIQIALELLKSCQAFIEVHDSVPSTEPQWLIDDDVNRAIDKNSGLEISSDNVPRWCMTAVYTSFNTKENQMDDITGDNIVNWDDIGKYAYYYGQYQTAYEESIAGEPEALYFAHNCLTTLLFSLGYYVNFEAEIKFDSKYDELPEAYSLNIWYIQDVNSPPDAIRKGVFSVFAAFGNVHNAFRNLEQQNTLFPSVAIPIQILDLDGDGLTNNDEDLLGSNPQHPDTDLDGIDDGSEYLYWNNPIYMQGSTPTQMVDSDGDGFLDIEEIYYFNTHPLVVNDDLDNDQLELSLDPDPRDPDYDNDYVLDGHEYYFHGTDPTIADSDGDTIIDGYEIFGYYTNPNEPDSDFDGLRDDEEIYGIILQVQIFNGIEYIIFPVECYSDPNSEDTDHDGITDGVEVDQGTLHVYWDTDLDGLSDGWEIENGFNALNSVDPVFQISYNAPDSPTDLNPGTFTWSITDYYPRAIESVSIKYKSPSASSSIEISTDSSGSYDLISEVGYHEFIISASNSNGLTLSDYIIPIYVDSAILDGSPVIYGSEDIITYEGTTNPNIVGWTIYDQSITDPMLNVVLDNQYLLFDYMQWGSGAYLEFDCNLLNLNVGFHYLRIYVWDDYTGAQGAFENAAIDEVLIYILDNDVIANPTNIASEIYGEYPLHGIPRKFGTTDITCEQIHIMDVTAIMVAEWDQNPTGGQNPFDSEVYFFTIQGSSPLNFTSSYSTIFTVPLPGDYNIETDKYILMKWDSTNNKWIHTVFPYQIDWIRGTYSFRLLEYGIFALGKYQQPLIQKPDDISYVYDDVNIETFFISWTLTESMITIPYCGFFFNFDWDNSIAEVSDWTPGSTLEMEIHTNDLPPGIYSITAIFYDPIMETYIRQDTHILVLENNILELNSIESAELYEHQTYTDISLGGLEIIDITTIGTVVFGGVWDQNPVSGSDNPFNWNNGVYFIVDSDQPEYAISFNDPEYPFILSVPLPADYNDDTDTLTLFIWNETTNSWEIVDFEIEIDISTNKAYIKMNKLGIFALGVIGPEYILGDVNTDGIVDIVDALLTAQYYVGWDVPGYNPIVADVNEDGFVDIVDALLIAQYYVGQIPELPYLV